MFVLIRSTQTFHHEYVHSYEFVHSYCSPNLHTSAGKIKNILKLYYLKRTNNRSVHCFFIILSFHNCFMDLFSSCRLMMSMCLLYSGKLNVSMHLTCKRMSFRITKMKVKTLNLLAVLTLVSC